MERFPIRWLLACCLTPGTRLLSHSLLLLHSLCLHTELLHHFILTLPLEGLSGYDGSSADAAAPDPQPAAGSDPPEATSPSATAGMHELLTLMEVVLLLLVE